MLVREDKQNLKNDKKTRVTRSFPKRMGNYFVLPDMDSIRECKPAGETGVGVGFGANFLIQDAPFAGKEDPDLVRDGDDLAIQYPVNRYFQVNAVKFKDGSVIEDRSKWPIWNIFYALDAFPLYSGQHPTAVDEEGNQMSWRDFLLDDFITNVQDPHGVEEGWFTQAGDFSEEQIRFWSAVGEWFKEKLRAIHDDPEGARPGIFQLEIRPDKRPDGRVFAQLEGAPLTYAGAKAQMDAGLPVCRREYKAEEKDLVGGFSKQKGSKPGTGGKKSSTLGNKVPEQQEVDLGEDDE